MGNPPINMAPRNVLKSELLLIRSVRHQARRLEARAGGLVVPMGDDAAAFRPGAGQLTLISCDGLVEGVHFDLRYFRPEDLGWKALAVNLSDIAAMGGTPRYFTTTLAMPRTTSEQFVKKLYHGMLQLARLKGVALIGGDTCVSPKGIFLDVTILGEVPDRELIARSGARSGDLLYVTGRLGVSAMGLECLKKKQPAWGRDSVYAQRHLRPMPRLEIGRLLASRYGASAMIDLSDGLSTDLNHLARESGVGAVVQAGNIPLPRVQQKLASLLPQSLLDYALHGGEDYELLFALPPHLKKHLPEKIGKVPMTQVGIMTGQVKGCWLESAGKRERLRPGGFDHFKQ